MADDDDPVAPRGSTQDHFVLMLHDRLVRLEGEVQELRPPQPDPRVNLLGTARAADTGAVFVRLKAARALDLDAWAQAMLRALGEREQTRFEAYICQHWGMVSYVVEALVRRSGTRALDVVRVAHAALDACVVDHEARVDACAVVSPDWFEHSIQCAAVATQSAFLRSWSPEAGYRVDDMNGVNDEGILTPTQRTTWALLHGWLAAQVERTDVWHPRALCASREADDLVMRLEPALPLPPPMLYAG